jgi:hypothetical protein
MRLNHNSNVVVVELLEHQLNVVALVAIAIITENQLKYLILSASVGGTKRDIVLDSNLCDTHRGYL